MSDAISEGKTWEKLKAVWEAQRKPGYVTLGGQEYRVIQPGDDKLLFVPQGGLDQHYGSRSTRGISS